MHPLRVLLVAMVVLGSACASSQALVTPVVAPAPTAETLPSGERLPTDVRPLDYAVALTIIPGAARFGGTVEIRVQLDRPRTTIWLNAEALHISEVLVDGASATWSPSATHEGLAQIMLANGAVIPAGEATLRVTFDAPMSHGGDSVFDVAEDGRHYVLTTFEPISARKALPCFDEPGFKVPYELILTVPADMVALANTPEIETTPAVNGMKTVRFARSQPLPSYLFAFAVGPFDVVTAPPLAPSRWRPQPLPIRGVALHGRGARLKDQLAQVGPIITALEDWFGSAYPYAKLDVVGLPSYPGAMENAALVLFDEYLMMVDRAHAALDEQREATTTLAHELAHQWVGNLVTMAWWDDLWLNEAFATWIADRVVATVRPELGGEAARIESWQHAMRADARASARRIRQPIESQHDMYSAFDSITYSKGASIIAMIEHWVGADAWQAGVRAYLAGHAFGNATTDDLLAEVSRAAGRDVATVFKTFLDQPGAPVVTIAIGAPAANHLPLTFDVARWRPTGSLAPAAGAWQVPVCIGGRGIADTCVLVAAPHQTIELVLTGEALDALVPNVGGVGYYQVVVQPESHLRAALTTPRSSAEAAAIVASYSAAFESGALPAIDVLDAMASLAKSTEPELVRGAIAIFDLIAANLLDDTTRPIFERRVRSLFAHQLTRLGWTPKSANEATEVRLLRGEVITFMARTARDPKVRAEAARLGRKVIGDGTLDRSSVAPELLKTVLMVAVEDGSPALFETARNALFASKDPALRSDLIDALATTRDPVLAARVTALVLDTRLTETEILAPLRLQLAHRETRPAAFAWLQTNFDALVARMPPFATGYLPRLVAPFCSAAERADARDLFEPRIGALPGAPRALAGALESIELCTALVTAQRDRVRQWLIPR